jgi:hypothetical protein
MFADNNAYLANYTNPNYLKLFANKELKKVAKWFTANKKMAVNVSRNKLINFNTKGKKILTTT